MNGQSENVASSLNDETRTLKVQSYIIERQNMQQMRKLRKKIDRMKIMNWQTSIYSVNSNMQRLNQFNNPAAKKQRMSDPYSNPYDHKSKSMRAVNQGSSGSTTKY